MNELALNYGQTAIKGKIIQANIGVTRGKITEISKNPVKGKTELNCTRKIIFPGAIDAHVHFRIPGGEKKEDWDTASKAAVAGGITTVFDMPNNFPAIDSAEELEKKRNEIKGKSYCNYGFFLAPTNYNLRELRKKHNAKAFKYYLGETTGKIIIDKDKAIIDGFKIAKKKNIPCFLHCESMKVIEENELINPKAMHVLEHNKIRSTEAETESVKKGLKLWKKAKNIIHFTHISCPESAEIILKEKSKKISFDVTPHHLFLNEENLNELNNYGKMNPPLRSAVEQKKMLEMLYFNKINFVFSDHAPHLKEEKEKPYHEAPSGVPGVQTLFPLLLNEAVNVRITFNRLTEITAENPAKLMNLKSKGLISKGFDADLIIINPLKENEIKNTEMCSKCGWTPFNGFKLKGKVETTIVNGKIAFNEGKFFEKNGKEVK
ncbi:MAG: dihydroorotase family protein [Candidatus Diapherotrites archaeon]|nr:dihydroorotase family protein [Candidatus Diapherotrites archaeon]